MTTYSITEWLQIATAGIVSPKERESAKQELLDHMEDHMDALVAAGFTKEDAEKHAVYAMGDPEDTAKLLRKTHQPILTRLLQVCKWLVIVMAVILFATYCRWETTQLRELAPIPLDYEEYAPFLTPGYNNPGWSKKLYILEEPVSTDCDGYRFTVERVAVMRDEEGEPEIILLMLAQSDGPLHKVPRLGGTMRVTDDLGNSFLAYNQDYTLNGGGWVQWEYTNTAETEGWHHITILYDRPIDHDFQWIELEYAMEETSFSLHIDLTGEVSEE